MYVRRYYRAPEIVLGYPVRSTALDMWSVGVTIAEMYR
jgi:serine/threonine protein kinase